MNATTWIAIVIPVWSAAATVAYKHPAPYRRLYRALTFILLIVAAAMVAFDVGIVLTFTCIKDAGIETGKLQAINEKVSHFYVSFDFVCATTTSIIFGTFLLWLDDLGIVAKDAG